MQGLYQRNRAVIHETLQGRSDWHIVEIGGGNGALSQGLPDTQQADTLTLIDPHAEAHTAVAARLPGNVTFRPIIDGPQAPGSPGIINQSIQRVDLAVTTRHR